MNLDKIKERLNCFIADKGLKLFDVTYKKGDQILAVTLDEKLNMDELEKISGEISEFMDRYEDEFPDNYFLDVSTIGVERPIRSKEEAEAAKGEYIYVKTKEEEYYGTLLDFDGQDLKLQIRDKTRDREISVPYEKCKKVRYAVKF